MATYAKKDAEILGTFVVLYVSMCNLKDAMILLKRYCSIKKLLNLISKVKQLPETLDVINFYVIYFCC